MGALLSTHSLTPSHVGTCCLFSSISKREFLLCLWILQLCELEFDAYRGLRLGVYLESLNFELFDFWDEAAKFKTKGTFKLDWVYFNITTLALTVLGQGWDNIIGNSSPGKGRLIL